MLIFIYYSEGIVGHYIYQDGDGRGLVQNSNKTVLIKNEFLFLTFRLELQAFIRAKNQPGNNYMIILYPS